MPPICSKPVPISVPCWVLSHNWSRSCTHASLEVLKKLVIECLRIYGLMYLASGVVRGKGLSYWRNRYIKDVGQSSAMLITNGFLIFSSNCFVRFVTGKFEQWHLKVMLFISSFIAIFWERPSRRNILALYMGSNAIECRLNHLIQAGVIKNVHHFDTIFFMTACSIFGYYLKSSRESSIDSLRSPLRGVLGYFEESKAIDCSMDIFERFKRSLPLHNELELFCSWFGSPRTPHCLHRISCLQYGFYGACRGLTVGYSLSLAVNILRRFPKLTSLAKLLKCVADPQNVRVALFLSALVTSFRAVSCFCRKLFGNNNQIIGAIAGFTSGLSFLLVRNYILSLYVGLKAVEVVGTELLRGTWLENGLRYKTELLYALAVTEAIFGVIVLPQNVRPEYRNFIQSACGWLLSAYNRQLAATHWALPVAPVAHYPALDPAMQPVYEYWANRERRKHGLM